MNHKSFVFMLLSCSILCANDVDVSIHISKLKNRSYTMNTSWGTRVHAEPEDNTTISMQLGYELIEIKSIKTVGYFTVNAIHTTNYHFTVSSINYFSEGTGKFTNEGAGIGVQERWGKMFEYSLGLEIRYERLTLDNLTPISVGQYRPWLNFQCSYIFKNTSYKPFIGIGAGMSLTHSTNLSPYYSPTGGISRPEPRDFVKSMSPNYELNLIIGIRK